MTPRDVRRRTIAALWGTGLATGAAVAGAEDAPIERMTVEVTGSNIRRVDGETALPVQVITREDIVRSGSMTMSELMSKVSANIGGFNDQVSIGNQIDGNRPGLSSVNLRGIGDGSTLVLVNGRRLANYAFDGGAVDIAMIPLAAIDRVEILKDGASAIYGTDAIAGVVNFILRKDFQGLTIEAFGSAPQHGGGDQQRFTGTVGWGDLAKQRVNAFITVDYQKQGALAAADRPFTRSGLVPEVGLHTSRDNFPANIPANRTIYSPDLGAGCAPPASRPDNTARGIPICGYDVAAAGDSIPPVETFGTFARATWQPGPDVQVFTEAAWSQNRLLLRVAPTPVEQLFTFGDVPVRYPAGGPFYPTAFAAANGLSGDLDLMFRLVPLGPRTDIVETHASRMLVGADGFAGGWDYSTAIVYSRNWQNDRLVSGWVSQERLLAGLATGLVNPFGPSGPEGDALLQASQVVGDVHQAQASTLLVDAKASRELMKLAGGPLALAIGAEARRERLDNTASPLLKDGDVLNIGERGNTSGRRTVGAAYIELGVPFIRDVEMQLAARYDHYDDFGGTTNPKVALRWQPSRALILRTSWGTGFRAPTLPDLYTPLSHGFTDPSVGGDPLRCPVTGQGRDCSGFFPTATGGNPGLQPEKSTQYNVGVGWSPSPDQSITLDYWNIRKRGGIATLNEFDVFGNFEVYGTTNIVRGPVDPAYPTLPGPIQTVLLWNQNLDTITTSGLDVDVTLRGPATSFGRLGFHFNGTYITDFTLRFNDVVFRAEGSNDLGLVVPRWKHYGALDWTYGPWTATLGHNYQAGHDEPDRSKCGESTCGSRLVGDYSVWDLVARYTGFRNVALTAGVKNLFDRNPPLAYLGSGRFQSGYDPGYADPRGRTFYAGVTVSFK